MSKGFGRNTSVALGVWVASVLIVPCGARAQAGADTNLTLRYERPSAGFEDALPLGNGRIGVMVYGDARADRLLLNEATLWAGGPVEREPNPDAIAWLPKIREALFRRDFKLADQLTRRMQGHYSASYAPLGDFYLEAGAVPDTAAVRRELDLATATARTTVRAGDVSWQREYFVSYPDRVFVVRLTTGKPGGLRYTVRAASQLRHQVQVTPEGDLLLSGRAPVRAEPNYRRDVPDPVVYDEAPDGRGTRFAARLRVLRCDGTVSRSAETLSFDGATEVVLAAALETSFVAFDREPSRGPDPVATTRTRLEALGPRSYQDLTDAHRRSHAALFGRVRLDLGRSPQDGLPTDRRLLEYAAGAVDPGLEALYYQFGRYLLVSASRGDGPPANLQGIWNPHVRPPWSSNYTVNINTQMNYWPAETTNLAECHEPLLRFIGDLAVTGAATARHFYGANGWCVHHNSDIWALSNPVGALGEGDPRWANWPMAGLWFSLHLWEHYQFSGDDTWLRGTAYPLMKGAVAFALDWLVDGPDGFLVTAPSTSPENGYRTPDGYAGVVSVMTTADLALIRGACLNLLEAGSRLRIDDAFSGRVRAALQRLPPYKVGARGHLQEWYDDWEDPEPEHRHVSHLIGMYPDDQISPFDTPALASAVRRSLELRGDGGTGWSKAWKIGLWARLHDGDHAYRMLRTHLQYVGPSGDTQYKGGGTYPNLFDAHPPFQIDGNFGGTAGMTEMLLQSHRGEIHLLPALPAAWKTGSVSGLRARGGYTVGITWRDGVVTAATIRADRDGPVAVRVGARTLSLDARAGVPLLVR